MKPVSFTPAAEIDLEQIWEYTATHWGVDQADRYIDDIADLCFALAGGDRRGRPVEIRPGCLKHAIGSHMIYFRHDDDRLVVLRILHVRQDVGRHL